MPAPDTKERNFCFAYRGDALRTDILEGLNVHNAEGAYLSQDGNWYARITMSRNHGRRMASIPNIIEEYNAKIEGGSKIELRTIPPLQTPIICFKATSQSADNPITQRIRASHRMNATYWEWNKKKTGKKQATTVKPARPIPAQAKKKPDKNAKGKAAATGLEGLVRELNLNPSTLDMRGAYAAVSRNYFLTKQSELNITGQISAEDKAFLLKQLKCYFSRQLAYVSGPYEAPKGFRKSNPIQKTMEALAANNGGTAEDFGFIRDGTASTSMHEETEPNPFTPRTPSESICKCFRHLTSFWAKHPATYEKAEVATNDIVCILNGGSMGGGAYRSTSIRGLVRPFIDEKLIRVKDEAVNPPYYIVDVKGMISKLDSIPPPP